MGYTQHLAINKHLTQYLTMFGQRPQSSIERLPRSSEQRTRSAWFGQTLTVMYGSCPTHPTQVRAALDAIHIIFDSLVFERFRDWRKSVSHKLLHHANSDLGSGFQWYNSREGTCVVAAWNFPSRLVIDS